MSDYLKEADRKVKGIGSLKDGVNLDMFADDREAQESLEDLEKRFESMKQGEAEK